MENTCSEILEYSRRHLFMGHCCFLKFGHHFKRDKGSLDGVIETIDALKLLIGHEIDGKVHNISNLLEKSM